MKGLKKGDIIIAAAVVLISAALFLISFLSVLQNDELYAEISVNGAVLEVLPLSTDFDFNTGVGVKIRIEDGAVYITESDCPDRLCVTAGKIKKAGQMLVCLPNRAVVKIVSHSGENGGVDAVA